jgi:hypothetical protein
MKNAGMRKAERRRSGQRDPGGLRDAAGSITICDARQNDI